MFLYMKIFKQIPVKVLFMFPHDNLNYCGTHNPYVGESLPPLMDTHNKMRAIGVLLALKG